MVRPPKALDQMTEHELDEFADEVFELVAARIRAQANPPKAP